MTPPDAAFELKFEGEIVEALGGAPAIVVAAALNGVQRLVHLIGMRHEGRTLDRRARPPATVQERYVVLCQGPRAGSHVEPFRIAPTVSGLVAVQAAGLASTELSNFLDALERRHFADVAAVVPDPTYRRFMLAAVIAMAPAPGSGVTLDVLSDGGGRRFRTEPARAFVSGLLRAAPSVDEDAMLIGRLDEIDFAARRMTLLELSTRRKLTCVYDEVVESMLLENPRELIQVFGTVVLDHQSRPESIQDVRLVQAVDRSPFRIEQFRSGNWVIAAEPLLELSVSFDAETQMLTAINAELGIDAFGETREALACALYDELDVLWRFYAQAPEADLAEDAVALKRRLLARFAEQHPDAAQAR